jgi:hypothetical protein
MHLEDRIEIEQLINLCAFLLDSRQHHRVAGEIFVPDATIDYGTGPISGHDAINAFFTGFTGEVAATAHCYSNFIIEVEGDLARSQSHVVAWHWLERPGRSIADPADITIVGGAQDQLKRLSEGWRISSRIALQYGVAVGTPSPGIRAVMEGMAKKRPTWPE